MKEKFTLSIDKDILAEIKEEAENDCRSTSKYIELILKRHIMESGHWNRINKKKRNLNNIFNFGDYKS